MTTLMNTPGFATAIVALIVALTAYIQQRITRAQQGAHIEALQKQADQPAPVPPTIVTVPAPPVPRAGGGALLAVDAVNQNAGIAVAPGPNSTGDVDCGLACCVSEIASVKRVWSADELLRLRYFGVVDRRLTTAHDIVGMLRANDIPAHERNVDAATARQEIVRNWQAGRSSIVLGDWVSPGYGHWMRFLGDDGGAEFMDPWPGAERRISWDRFAQLYDGWYVHVDAAPGPPLCGAS